jgi:cyanophycinase
VESRDEGGSRRSRSLSVLREARIYWFGGGSQERIMQLLDGTRALALLRENHARGALVGGTSAGAAVLGDVMLIPRISRRADRARSSSDGAGARSAPDFIVDQHLLARARMVRLLNILPEHPSMKGLGLEERTAAIISDDAIEIVGAGQAVLYSQIPGATAALTPTTTRPLWRIPEVRVSVLLPGDRVPR